MSVQNLFLSQQMRRTQENLDKVQAEEQKRRKKAGAWSSGLGMLGGAAGGLLALAASPWTGGASLALATGLGASAGSLFGARAGLEIGDGRQSDAVPIGMNTSAISGREKEFSSDVQSKYRRNIGDFQTQLNNAISSQAINTGIKAASMAYANPTAAQGLRMDMRSGASKMFGGGAAGPVIPQVNLAGAQAYNPLGDPTGGTLFQQAPQVSAPVDTLSQFQGPPTELMGYSQFPAPSVATPPVPIKQPNNMLNISKAKSDAFSNVAPTDPYTTPIGDPTSFTSGTQTADNVFDQILGTGSPQGEGALQYDSYQNELDPFGLTNFNSSSNPLVGIAKQVAQQQATSKNKGSMSGIARQPFIPYNARRLMFGAGG